MESPPLPPRCPACEQPTVEPLHSAGLPAGHWYCWSCGATSAVPRADDAPLPPSEPPEAPARGGCFHGPASAVSAGLGAAGAAARDPG
jgi:hypothetical protein